MVGITRITYHFDPLCCWCYGASAKLEQLAAQPDIALHLVPTGPFSGAGGALFESRETLVEALKAA